MSTSRDLYDGIAAMMVAGVAGTSYTPSGVTVSGGITVKNLPSTPDKITALNVVIQGDDVTMPRSQVMVQLRARGLPNDPIGPDEMLDAFKEILHGTSNLVMGATTVIQMNRRIRVPMGMDLASKRWESIDQYYLDVDVAPTAVQPAQGSW